jgi:eukaryotic-like serine/threonine-protein kinase
MAERLPGKTLGDFLVGEFIGKGAMAKVYKAVQLSLNRPVALKVLEEGLFTLDELKQRFLREAQAIARLEHPHIVPIYGAGQQGKLHYYAMRYIEGRTLEQELKAGLPLGPGLRHLADIAGALGYAHDRNLVHRDVKPANIILSDGVAILADFGLARLLDQSTITGSGQLIGTPLYFSPEQAKQERATAQSDLYALGIIVYELATGRHPFNPHQGLDDLLVKITASTFVPPAQLRPGLPSGVEELIRRALRPDPKERYANGHEFRAALLAAAALCSSDAQAVAGPGSSTRSASRSGKGRTCGTYTIHELLGERPGSRVYRAEKAGSNRRFAVKVFEGDIDRIRFAKEVAVVARLRHPNLVSVHETGEADGRPYLAMDYVEGTSLQKILEGGIPSVRTSLEIVRDVGRALQYAHEQGVVHGRLDVARILIAGSGQALVGGFGAGEGDPKADLRALGAVLYHLVTGRPLQDEVVPPRKVNARIHEDVQKICFAALDGYADAGEMAADLERFLAGEAIQASPSGKVLKLWRKLRPKPAPRAPLTDLYIPD